MFSPLLKGYKMAKQNLSDQELAKFISSALDIVKLNDSKKSILDLFGAFVGLVADDYPERTKQYLKALKQINNKPNPHLRLIK